MDAASNRLRDLVQRDPCGRGLATCPDSNLLTACPDDFVHACRDLAGTDHPAVGIVTGFWIPTAQPPRPETDGPLGAVFLARALAPLGFRVVLLTDAWGEAALSVGLRITGWRREVDVVVLPTFEDSRDLGPAAYRRWVFERTGPLTHLIALERPGPSHTLATLQAQGGEALGQTLLDFLDAVPEENQDRCHSMRGRDITHLHSPAHWLFEAGQDEFGPRTIGIGDGGNEIGMGRIPWDVVRRNIAGGGLVACRIPTDRLVVCGISNWGAYALAAGILRHRKETLPAGLFRPETELRILQAMVEQGGLVDGVSGLPTPTVDGLAWDPYAAVLKELADA